MDWCYGATVLPKEEPVPFYKNVWLWAILAVCIFAALNIAESFCSATKEIFS